MSHDEDRTVGGIPEGIEAAAYFRHVMAAIPTSVVALSGRSDREPVVMILGSFTSVSLDPMLVGFLVGRDAARWQLLRESDRFCVNVLDESQAWISAQLARPGPPDLTGIEWAPSPHGAIALAGTIARFDVTPIGHHDAGDHLFVLCRVDHLEEPTRSTPLVYHDGVYTGVRTPDAWGETHGR
jgi:flavin reductase (DIM6/NTAB) family NADH-FMN oxidoreductase RutF